MPDPTPEAPEALEAPGAPGAPAALEAERFPAARRLGLLLLLGGAIGALASAVLTYDRIETLANPGFAPGCNINAVFSCGDVMETWQGNLLGFPNMLIGLPAFAALAALGLALLAGAAFPRWLWRLIWAGCAGAFGFVCWLIAQCLYVIGALCPWCMVVWAVVLPLFWYVTVHGLRIGALPAPRRLVAAVTGYAWVGPVVLCGAVLVLVLTRFGDQLL